MNGWKKGLAVVGATVLAASLPLYTKAADNISITGKIFPKAGINMNFTSVDFNGTLGDVATATYKNGGTTVSAPTISVRYKDNFNVGVKSSSFTGTDSTNNVLTLDTKRIKITADKAVQLTSTAQDILTGTGDGTAAQSITKPLDISLDLSETGYSDQIKDLSSQANLSATVTVSFNGL